MEEEQKRWESCCFVVDQNMFKYITQVMFGISVITFSMVQIIRREENAEIYFSLLSGTLGLFLPHPTIKD
jgi:hypothetical protein